MIDLDEDALICDFAETYHIYDYRSLPASMAATLAVGLRDDSRIKRKIIQEESGLRVSSTELLLSILIDRVSAIGAVGGELPPSLFEQCFDGGNRSASDEGVQHFSSAAEFETARHNLLAGGTNDVAE